jgi:hypothetical protein
MTGRSADATSLPCTYKLDSQPLDKFIKQKGGTNACAVRFSQRLGRIRK